MRFDYSYSDGTFLPIIPVKLRGREWTEFLAFLDTGASYSIFQADVAEILGIKMEDGEEREVVIGDGDKLKVYLHKIEVALAGKEFLALIGFSKGLGTGLNILGRKDIFEQFTICFKEKEKAIEFTPTD